MRLMVALSPATCMSAEEEWESAAKEEPVEVGKAGCEVGGQRGQDVDRRLLQSQWGGRGIDGLVQETE